MATEILNIDEMTAAQADKYLTHNTANRQLEAQMVRVLDRDAGAAPGGPAEGDTYIVDVASGAWASATVNDIAHYYSSTWKFYTPTEGMRVWVNDEDILVVYDGSSWDTLPAGVKIEDDQSPSLTTTFDSLQFTNDFSVTDNGDGTATIDGTPQEMYSGDSKVVETTSSGLYFGSGVSGGNRGYIWANGTGTYLQNYEHGTPVTIQSENASGTMRTLVQADPDTSVDLYHSGAKQIETLSGGIYFGSNVSGGNRGLLYHGNESTNGLLLRNESSTSGVNKLVLASRESSGGSSTILLVGDPDGAATLYHAGTARLATNSTGITVNTNATVTHDGTDLILDNNTEGGNVTITGTSGNSPTQTNTLFDGDPDGAAKLFYNNATVLETDSAGIKINSGPTWTSGTGSPESAVTAPVGSLYSRTDGGASTTLYVKESGSGNTGWVAK